MKDRIEQIKAQIDKGKRAGIVHDGGDQLLSIFNDFHEGHCEQITSWASNPNGNVVNDCATVVCRVA